MSDPIVRIYTDGSCIENHLKGGGVGGWGAVLEYVVQGEVVHRKSLCGALPITTNNRAELEAAVHGLRALKRDGLAVQLVTDSQYVAGQLAGNRTNANHDLVLTLRELAKRHEVTVIVVKGHSGNAGNETCHELAEQAARAYMAQAKSPLASPEAA